MSESIKPNALEPDQPSDFLEAARREAYRQAQTSRRSPRVENVEGKGAMVVSISSQRDSSQREITAQPFDPNHDSARHERAEASEHQRRVENIDLTTQAQHGYRSAYLNPTMLDSSAPEQPAPYLEKDAA